jgi:hypothetical protein
MRQTAVLVLNVSISYLSWLPTSSSLMYADTEMITRRTSRVSYRPLLITCSLLFRRDVAVRVRAIGPATIGELGDHTRFRLEDAVVDGCVSGTIGIEGGALPSDVSRFEQGREWLR